MEVAAAFEKMLTASDLGRQEAHLTAALTTERQHNVFSGYDAARGADELAFVDATLDLFLAHFPAQAAVMRVVWHHCREAYSDAVSLGCECAPNGLVACGVGFFLPMGGPHVHCILIPGHEGEHRADRALTQAIIDEMAANAPAQP